jgi:hypothetical protein
VNIEGWLGNHIFDLPIEKNHINCDTSYVSQQNYSCLYNPEKVLLDIHELASQGSMIIDLYGYFQFHTSHYQDEKEFIFNLFKPTEIANKFISNIQGIINKKITALHIRRGDYATYSDHPFFWTCDIENTLLHLINNHSDILLKNIIYISSDDLNYCKIILDKFGINYISNQNFTQGNSENDKLLIDFLFMRNADSLIISNSSLSFFAAMLNTNCDAFLRPSPDQVSLVDFDPWNSSVLLSK